MKTRLVALAVAATMGLGSVSAFAQDHHRDGGRHEAWQHQRFEQHRNDWAYHNRYVAPRYYGPSYRYQRDDGGDVVGALLLGALTGALVGQAANASTYSAPPAYYAPPPATYYNPGYGYYGY
jgi:hypothetical protein